MFSIMAELIDPDPSKRKSYYLYTPGRDRVTYHKMATSLEDKTHDEMVYSPTCRRSIPRRNSLRLLTSSSTPNIPVPPSLQKSPYLTSSTFSCDLPSPTRPNEADERWLQDTIPLYPRRTRNVQLPDAASAGLAAQAGGCVSESWSADRKRSWSCETRLLPRAATMSGRSPQHHPCRHIMSDSYGDSGDGESLETTNLQTSDFLPPSSPFIDIGWRSAALYNRRWSDPLPKPDQTFQKV